MAGRTKTWESSSGYAGGAGGWRRLEGYTVDPQLNFPCLPGNTDGAPLTWFNAPTGALGTEMNSMKNVSSILLAIDGDHEDQALISEVDSIASDDRTHITILSITEPVRRDPDNHAAMVDLLDWESKMRAIQLDKLTEALAKNDRQVAIQHASGTAYLEIIRETLKSRYDLIIKPARHDGGFMRLLLRGADIQLLSLCPIPVWIFQPTASRSLKKIAVAVDPQPDDSERRALAEKVLKWGKLVAELSNAELHVIHAWSLYREERLRSRSAFSDIVDNLSASKERLHRQWLCEALQQTGLDDDGIHEHLVKGDPRLLIPKIAAEMNIDLLVMGTVSRTGIPGFFIGNTADSVLRNVDCSVFAVKPERFSTPIESNSQN